MKATTQLNNGYSLALVLSCSWSVPAFPKDSPGTAAFNPLDNSGDGNLSRDEIPAALFDRLDANRDGFVSEDKLKALWRNRQ